MMPILKFLSAVGLGLTVIPSFLVYAGNITWDTHAGLMMAGTILWFVTAPFWMNPGKPGQGFWKRRRPV